MADAETPALELLQSDAPDAAAQLLKGLSHPDRLRILCTLAEGPQPVSEIEAMVGISQSAVSQHLARLRAEALVCAERQGRQVYYRIDDPTVLAIIQVLYERFCPTDI